MFDWGLDVLEQYGLESTAVYRGRGSLICETDRGLVMIREFCGMPQKLETQAFLLHRISQNPYVCTDEILQNKEGTYLTQDKNHTSYIVKRWYEGRECDTRNEQDILFGIRSMARLHKGMSMPVQAHYVRKPLTVEYVRHNAELRKIRKYIRNKRKKDDFELAFLDTVQRYLKDGEQALKRLETSRYPVLCQEILEAGSVCHGAFHQHNVWMLRNPKEQRMVAVTNFEQWCFGIQILDLYQFMRKMLEKHDWDLGFGRRMLEHYEQIRPLTEAERENLKIRFAYPEKYWKLANYYYTHNKAWISVKNLEKLNYLVRQEEKWRNFAQSL